MQAQDGSQPLALSQLYAVDLSYQDVGVAFVADARLGLGGADGVGDGHPGVQPQRRRRVPQVIRVAAEQRPVLDGGEGVLTGFGPELVVAGVLQDVIRAA